MFAGLLNVARFSLSKGYRSTASGLRQTAGLRWDRVEIGQGEHRESSSMATLWWFAAFRRWSAAFRPV